MTVSEHIENLPLPVKKIVKALRSIARKNMPGAYEMVYHNALGYATSESPFDRVAEAKNEALKILTEAAWKKVHKDVAGWRQSLKRKNK